MATNARMRALLNEAQRLVAQGFLSQAEAEGALIGALNWLAPDDAASARARTMAQISPEIRDIAQDLRRRLGEMQDAHLARAKAGLLAISDEEWAAAGGSNE